MPLPATIQTAVSPEAIHRASRLFSGGALDAMHEILQNSRRAGATRIAIDMTQVEGCACLDIRDDGCGIDDPAALLTLGFSGWNVDIAQREDPAGMGLFSLAGLDIEIHSFSPAIGESWKVRIPARAWDSGAPLALEPCDLGWGTLIRIAMPEDWKLGIRSVLAQAARHYPLPVTMNGVLLHREDFLKDAIAIEEMQGCRIGVYKADPHGLDGCRVNFHGLQVRHGLPMVREVGMTNRWSVRVDIVDAPQICLVLPARKEFVRNNALAALHEAAEIAIYRTIAAQPGHRLTFTDYERARDLGIALPEARVGLVRWRPETADDARGRSTAHEERDGVMLLVPTLEADIAQALALAADNDALRPYRMVEAEDNFQGYSWYDRLPGIDAISFRIVHDGIEHHYEESGALPQGLTSGRVENIFLDLVIGGPNEAGAGSACPRIAIDALVCRNDGWSLDEAVILVPHDSVIAPDRLARMIYAALFCADDDSDCDSWETQSRDFDREARVAATQILLGPDAALLQAVRMAASDNLSWLIPDDRAVRLVLRRGAMSVDFLPDAEAA